LGASAFAMDLRNKRRWISGPLVDKDAQLFKDTCLENGFSPNQILPHGSYLINCGHPFEEGLKKSRAALLDELERCQKLGLRFYNFHPGTTKGQIEIPDCLARIAETINWAHQQVNDVVLVIENTAGQGFSVGRDFEQIATIISHVKLQERVGVCLETCHLFSASYDLSTPEKCHKVFEEFDRKVGTSYLRGLHLNDSKTPFNSKKDRHESLGIGSLGWSPFQYIMNQAKFDQIPLILETPDPERWKDEISALKKFENCNAGEQEGV